jgi:hypothetical protein
VDDYLPTDPIDIVAALATQRPRDRRECTRVRLFAIVFVGADVAILTEGAPHVARGKEDRA